MFAIFVFTSSLILHPSSLVAGPIANVDYIHKYIASKNGVSVPIKESDPSKAANVKYLLCAIDKANELSVASTNTSYCTHSLATTRVVDTIAVADASTRLFNCNAGGYYKAGGATACADCGAGYYCPAGGNVRNACTYGAEGCSGANHTSDTLFPMPNYATSGLVMHFDAIENNSSGGHTGGALNTWYDLTGNGYNLTSAFGVAPTAYLWGVALAGAGQGYKTAKVFDMTPYSNVTVEIRYRTLNPIESMAWEFTANWNLYAGGFGLVANSSGNLMTLNECHTNQYKGGTANYACNINTGTSHTHTNTFSSVANATGRMIYFDGAVAGGGSLHPFNSTDNAPFASDYFYMGMRGDTPNWGSDIEVQSFRVYTRQLTAAEVCQNAKADYARFGGAAPSC